MGLQRSWSVPASWSGCIGQFLGRRPTACGGSAAQPRLHRDHGCSWSLVLFPAPLSAPGGYRPLSSDQPPAEPRPM